MTAPEIKKLPYSSGLVNSIANILGLLIPLGIFFLVTPTLINSLGTDHFGVLTLFLAGVALLGSFDFGLGTGGVRALGEVLHSDCESSFVELAREWWSAYLMLGLLMAIGLLVLGGCFFDVSGVDNVILPEIRWHIIFAFVITVFCGFCVSACQLVWRAKESFLGGMVLQAIYGSMIWLGVGGVAWLGFGIEWVLSWIAFVSVCSVLLNQMWVSYLVKGLRWWPQISLAKVWKSRSYSFHAFWGQVASSTTYHADKFIISSFLGPVSVGYYGIASSLSSKILMLVATGAGFIFPRVVRLSAKSETNGLSVTYLQASRYVVLISWPLVITAFLLGDRFLGLWLGDEISTGVIGPLKLLLIAYFVNSLSVVASQVFSGLGNAKVGAVFASIGAVINLLGCLIFIPFFGLMGVALASCIASLQVFVFMVVLHRRLGLEDWPFRRFWVQIVMVSVGQSLLAWGLFGFTTAWPGFLIVAMLVWSLFYMIWFGFGFAEEAEKDIVRRLFSGAMSPFRKQL